MSETAERPPLAIPAATSLGRFATLWKTRWLGVALIVVLLILWEIAAASGRLVGAAVARL